MAQQLVLLRFVAFVAFKMKALLVVANQRFANSVLRIDEAHSKVRLDAALTEQERARSIFC